MKASTDHPTKNRRWKLWSVPALLLGVLAVGSLLPPAGDHDCGGACPVHAPEPPAEASVLLSDWPPETVMASVDGHEITLGEVRRVRDGKLSGMPPGAGIRDAALLELMIRRHMLAESARSWNVAETGTFRETLARLRETPAADWMTETDLEQRALAETFLEREVIAQMDIQPEDLEDMYEIFGPTLPEGTSQEDARPLFERRLKRQAVEAYMRRELDRRQVFFHDVWLGHVARQAAESPEPVQTD